jgi:NAD(P)H-dependent FMN reductase
MILVVSGTNKANSNSRKIAEFYFNLISQKFDDVKRLYLDEVDFSFIRSDMYSDHSADLVNLQKQYFDPATKILFVIPEYNGSIPGILKLLIDALDVRPAFRDKKATIVGVATGRAGNLRGLDHLMSILQHMQMNVMPGSLPISKVGDLIDNNGAIDESTNKVIDQHISKFLKF